MTERTKTQDSEKFRYRKYAVKRELNDENKNISNAAVNNSIKNKNSNEPIILSDFLTEKDLIKFQAFSIEKEKSFDFGEENLVQKIFLNKKRISAQIKLNKSSNIITKNNNINKNNNDIIYNHTEIPNDSISKNSNHILIQDENFENCQMSLDLESIKVPEFPIKENKFNTITIGNSKHPNNYLEENEQLKNEVSEIQN